MTIPNEQLSHPDNRVLVRLLDAANKRADRAENEARHWHAELIRLRHDVDDRHRARWQTP